MKPTGSLWIPQFTTQPNRRRAKRSGAGRGGDGGGKMNLQSSLYVDKWGITDTQDAPGWPESEKTPAIRAPTQQVRKTVTIE